MFSKKAIGIIGISTLSGIGIAAHYCSKHNGCAKNIAWLEDNQCLYKNTVHKIKKDSDSTENSGK